MSDQFSLSRLSGASFSLLCFVLTVFLVSSSAFAQVTASGALRVTVADTKGGVIKGATVTITSKATGQSRTATTEDDGTYKFDLLPAGSYDVKVSASGFGDATSENAQVLVGQTNGLNFTLNP